MRSPLGMAQGPYNSEGDYQDYSLDIFKTLDLARERFDGAPSAGNLLDLKKKMKTIIKNMARNKKFYKTFGKEVDGSELEALRDHLKTITDHKRDEDLIDHLLDEIDFRYAKAGIFLKEGKAQKNLRWDPK